MLSLRRNDNETRIEMMPMIDVIFLLLTFFIYAMVLMVQVELVPMELQSFASGEPATPAPTVTISLMRDGSVRFNRDLVAVNEITTRIAGERDRDPDTVIFLALEDGQGSVDRGPILTSIWDQLKFEGLEINFVGRLGESDRGVE